MRCYCGNEFAKSKPWQKYCSIRCGNRKRGKKRTTELKVLRKLAEVKS